MVVSSEVLRLARWGRAACLQSLRVLTCYAWCGLAPMHLREHRLEFFLDFCRGKRQGQIKSPIQGSNSYFLANSASRFVGLIARKSDSLFI